MFCKRRIEQAPPPPFDPAMLEALIDRIEETLRKELCGVELLAALTLERTAEYQRRGTMNILMMGGVTAVSESGTRGLLREWVAKAEAQLRASASS